MPTRTKNSPPAHIKWETFVIVASDSAEVKGNLMRDSVVAMKNNKNVAVLGIQIKTDGAGGEETVVFLHRTGGDKVSHKAKNEHASSRSWKSIDRDRDPVWMAFKKVVGKEKKVVTYERKDSGNLPSCHKH